MSPAEIPGPFLQACAGQVPDITPVWLMRQAGRILKPYRELREKHGSIQTLFTTPELAAEITLMPVGILEVDAAILFTDLVTPLEPMGGGLEYSPGPIFSRPVRSREDVEALRPVSPENDVPFVLETIRLVRTGLPAGIPLIGYAGAPFTLATWLVEGRGAKDFPAFRQLLYRDPETAHLLLDKLTRLVVDFLKAQIRAGAQAVQLFDTSIGVLSPTLFQGLVLPYLRRIFSALAEMEVPRIYFPLGAAHLCPYLGNVGADVLGLDWRIELARAFEIFSPELVLQGNLDPCALYAPAAILVSEAQKILQSARTRPHIFNLGHGVLPDTPYDNIRLLIDTVHEFGDGNSGRN